MTGLVGLTGLYTMTMAKVFALVILFASPVAGLAAETTQVVQRLDAACRNGDNTACVDLSLIYDTGRVVPQDRATALALLRRACTGGLVDGCTFAAQQYLDGDGVKKNVQMGLTLLRRACDLGGMMDCQSLAFLYAPGGAAATDPAKMLSYLQRACDGDYLSACHALGIMVRDGDHGAPVDHVRADRVLQKACTGHEERACSALGHMFENGLGRPRDMARALALYRIDCERALHCFELNRLTHLLTGQGATPLR